MPRIWKRIKKYERWILLAIVIIVLATFSVSGQCTKDPRYGTHAGGGDLGGSYEAAQGRRESVDGEEFFKTRQRYLPVYRSPAWGPTLRWADEFATADPSKDRLSDDMATWAHVAAVGAARAAGYSVGEEELKNGIRKMVDRATQSRGRSGPPFSAELYERVLSAFRMNRMDFETTVTEILLKDKYFAPIVDASRLALDREDAFKAWKAEKERVDLEFAAVPAAQFADRVKQVEETRTSIARQSVALDKVVAATQEIRRIESLVEAAKAAGGGALPKDEAALLATEGGKKSLLGKMPTDAWGKPGEGGKPAEPGKPYVYAVSGESYTITSAGPDGKAGTPDDVDRRTAAVLDTMVALRRTADALVAWHATTEAWPATLPDLTKVPPPAAGKVAAPAPLASLPKDAFDREFVYDPASPSLISVGADGVKGTPDDLTTEITADRARVPVPAALAPFVEEGLKDAWGALVSIQLASASPITFEVRSAGPDGKAGTADDVTDGNEIDLLNFYSGVRADYRLPEKRQFEVLFVAPVLVPDEIFAAAWKAHPELRPSEQDAFDFFRTSRGAFYTTSKKGEGEAAKDVDVDPADPVEGYGTALIKALRDNGTIARSGKTWQVPAAATLGEQAEPPAKKEGQPDPAADPIWKNYVEKGWRRVVLRDQFFEKLINDVLVKARESADAIKAWEKGDKKTPAPVAQTFRSALERFADLQPGEAEIAAGARTLQYFATKPDASLSREDWEKLPDLGDVNTSETLKRLKDDAYATIPALLRNGTLRAAFHNQKTEAPREPDLVEVREKVFVAYLEGRAMDRAARELGDVMTKLKEKDSKLADVLAAAGAKDKGDFTWSIGRTGPFVGSLGARRPLVAEPGASDEVQADIRRRNYVRKYGYDAVKTPAVGSESASTPVGTVGRRVLKDVEKGDDSTRSAYVVRVAWAEDPSPDEFHAKDYAKAIADAAGESSPYGASGRLSQRKGDVPRQLARLFDNWNEIRHIFGIETNSPVVEREARGRP